MNLERVTMYVGFAWVAIAALVAVAYALMSPAQRKRTYPWLWGVTLAWPSLLPFLILLSPFMLAAGIAKLVRRT